MAPPSTDFRLLVLEIPNRRDFVMRLSLQACARAAFRRIHVQHVSIVIGLSLAAVLALSVRESAPSHAAVVSAHQHAVSAYAYRTTAADWTVVYIAADLRAVEHAKAALWAEVADDGNASISGFEAFWSGTVLLVRNADEETRARALVDAGRGADYFADPAWRFLVFDLRPEQDGLWPID
jgi:hypothetical protein